MVHICKLREDRWRLVGVGSYVEAWWSSWGLAGGYKHYSAVYIMMMRIITLIWLSFAKFAIRNTTFKAVYRDIGEFISK